MNAQVTMNVSSLMRHDGEKAVYVLFRDAKKQAEFLLPEEKVLRNEGFTEEELRQLKEYVANEKDTIMRVAASVNPMKAFLEERVKPEEDHGNH